MTSSRHLRRLRSTDYPRRTVLRGAAGLFLAWMTPVRAAGQDADAPPPAAGDLLVRVDDPAFIPLAPDDVPFDGRGVMVWAIGPQANVPKQGSMNRILLARLNPATLGGATRANAADDIVAYSATCTHSGCEVDESLGESQTIFCGCHNSTFDPRDSGAVIGGPAPRRLPALPLRVDSGRLVVAGPFTSMPGFGPMA